MAGTVDLQGGSAYQHARAARSYRGLHCQCAVGNQPQPDPRALTVELPRTGRTGINKNKTVTLSRVSAHRP
jgi:hypothetical protein